MSVPRLSFREKPLRMPRMVQRARPQTLVMDVESQKVEPEPQEPPRNYMWIVAVVVFMLIVRLWSMWSVPRTVHTIKHLKCAIEKHTMTCKGVPQGTFIVEAPESCSQSIYDIGGFPFSVAMQENHFKVPAKQLTVSGIHEKCDVRAYVDSSPMTLHVPFTWVTTAQHTAFTLKDGDNIIVDGLSASLFDSVTRGSWIAYTYDIPGTTAEVIGDGTDIIYLYGVV